MQAEDARVRERLAATGELFDGYHPQMEKTHLENAAALEKMIDENDGEWLGKSLVGADGAEAAWLIAQHAISLPDFSCRVELKKPSRSEAEPFQRRSPRPHSVVEGKPQRYGSQIGWNAGRKCGLYARKSEK